MNGKDESMSRYRILLADDEQIERMALAKRLNRHFGDSLDISRGAGGIWKGTEPDRDYGYFHAGDEWGGGRGADPVHG